MLSFLNASTVRYCAHVLLGILLVEFAISQFRDAPMRMPRCAQQQQGSPRSRGTSADDATTSSANATAANATEDDGVEGIAVPQFGALDAANMPPLSNSVFHLHHRTTAGRPSGGQVLSISQPLAGVGPGLVFGNESQSSIKHGIALQIPSDTTRICVDVGTYIHSPTSKTWWAKDPRTFVVAVEANPYSQMLMWRLAHPQFIRSVAGYWPAFPRQPSFRRENATYACDVNEFADCILRTWSHITDNYHRFLLLPMAAGVDASMTSFQLGAPGRPDSGSVLEFRAQYRKKRGLKYHDWALTPVAPLSDILKMTPASLSKALPAQPILWDTLKIDAQGFDAAVVAGGGQWLSHFACIIGEFDKRAYAGGPNLNYHQYLIFFHGFAQVNTNVYVNRRFEGLLLSRGALCSAADVTVSISKIRKALAKFNAIFGPWSDEKSFFHQQQQADKKSMREKATAASMPSEDDANATARGAG